MREKANAGDGREGAFIGGKAIALILGNQEKASEPLGSNHLEEVRIWGSVSARENRRKIGRGRKHFKACRSPAGMLYTFISKKSAENDLCGNGGGNVV